MFKRLFASASLVLAGVFTTTGVSQAAIDTRSEVMYLAGVVVVVFLIVSSAVAAVAYGTGALHVEPEAPDEAERGIRKSGFGEAAFDAAHGHEHHATDHAEAADAHGGHAAAAGAHH